MLKSIPAAHSECTAKQETRRDTLFLIWLTSLAMIEKRSKSGLKKKEMFLIVKNVVLTKNWFVVSNFLELPKDHTEK